MATGRVQYQIWVATSAHATWVRDELNKALDRPVFADNIEPEVPPTVLLSHWGQWMVEGSVRLVNLGDEVVIRDRFVQRWSTGQGATRVLPGSWVMTHTCLHDEGRLCDSPVWTVKA